MLFTTPDEDYIPLSGTLTFEPGETEKTLTLTILDDSLYEPRGIGAPQVILTNLTDPVVFEGGAVSKRVSFFSGPDSDPKPTASMENVTVDEDAGTMNFVLTLSHGVEGVVEFYTQRKDVSGTAASGSDYEPILDLFNPFEQLKFEVPSRQTSATFPVTIIDDAEVEGDETLNISWHQSNQHTDTSTISVTGTIRDNDVVLPTLDLNVSSIATDDVVNIAEKASGFGIAGDTGTEPGVSVTVRVGTEELTAESSDDGAGTARWTVSVPADASYLSGTGVEVRVSASKAGFTAPAEVVRTLSLSLVGPVAPTYTEPSSLRVGEAITAMSPRRGSGDRSLRRDGSAVGSRDRRGERRDQRDAGPGGRESRGCDGDGDVTRRGTRRRYR